MKLPRSSIAGVMAFTVIVALNLGLGRAVLDRSLVRMPASELIILGVFPMANILMIGGAMLIGRHRAGRRLGGGLIGFEVAGGLAVLAAFAAITGATGTIDHWLHAAVRPLPFGPGLRLASCAAGLLACPQAAVALAGWGIGRLAEGRTAVGPRQGLDLAAAGP